MTRRLQLGALAVLLAIAAPAAAAGPEPGFKVDLVIAAESVMGAGAESRIRPSADVKVDGPIAIGSSTPLRANVRLRLFGMPGEAFDLTDVATVKTVEASFGTSFRVGRVQLGGQELWTSIKGEWGFATALPSGDAPPSVTRHLRHLAGGLLLEERSSGAWLHLMGGVDDAVGEGFALMLGGAVPISVKDRGVFSIGGDASLSAGGACAVGECRRQDYVRINVGVSVPDLVAVIR